MLGLFVAGFEVLYLIASSPPMDPFGYLIGRDFVNTWKGGRIALTGDPSQWFPHEAYNLALQAQFGADYPLHLWGYPPHLLLMTWPFGLLPYLPAYLVWCAAGFAAYMLAAADGERRFDHLAPASLVTRARRVCGAAGVAAAAACRLASPGRM